MQPSNVPEASQPAAATTPPALPPLSSAAPVASVPAPAAPASTTPATAEDNDLIEKEWVVQAKQVLAANAGNPYEQNKQFTRLKADYMQKRYGKDLKIDG